MSYTMRQKGQKRVKMLIFLNIFANLKCRTQYDKIDENVATNATNLNYSLTKSIYFDTMFV